MRRLLIIPLCLFAAFAGGAVRRVQDQCGPFTDVSPLFCPYVLEAYYTGITAGTSPTTFSPDLPITRGQAAVFTTKALNQALSRGSQRAALGQWWTTTPHWDLGLGVTSLPGAGGVEHVASDGVDVWAVSPDAISRVRASDGRYLEQWSCGSGCFGLVIAMGRVFTSSGGGDLSVLDPSQPAGSTTVAANGIGSGTDLVFDGSRIWSTSEGASIAIITPAGSYPWKVTTVTNPAFIHPFGAVFDGFNVWVTDNVDPGFLYKLDGSGNIIQTVGVGGAPAFPVFDGANIWVPNYGSGDVTVVSASTGAVLQTLSGNGMSVPYSAAFDGERVAIANIGGTVSLFRAADLSPLGFAYTNETPKFVCSDGIHFWFGLVGAGQIGMF